MQTATIQRRIETLPALSRTGKRFSGPHRRRRSRYLLASSGDPFLGDPGGRDRGVVKECPDSIRQAEWSRRLSAGPLGEPAHRDAHRPGLVDEVSLIPPPGKAMTPIGIVSSIASLRRNGAARLWRQSGLKATWGTSRASAHFEAISSAPFSPPPWRRTIAGCLAFTLSSTAQMRSTSW